MGRCWYGWAWRVYQLGTVSEVVTRAVLTVGAAALRTMVKGPALMNPEGQTGDPLAVSCSEPEVVTRAARWRGGVVRWWRQ